MTDKNGRPPMAAFIIPHRGSNVEAMAIARARSDAEAIAQARGLEMETVLAAGLRRVTPEEASQLLQIPGIPCGGIAIPYPGADGYCRVRLDQEWQAPGWNKPGKYLSPKGERNRLYIPPTLARYVLNRPETLVITEGEFKALRANEAGIHCIATAGIYSWKTRGPNGERQADEDGLLDDFRSISWARRPVVLVYDSDIMPSHPAYDAYPRLARQLLRLGAKSVKIITLPAVSPNGKTGLDDFLAVKTARDFWRLVNAAPEWEPLTIDASEMVEPAPWPAPLAEEAYHGLAGEFVRTLGPHTEADPAAILVQFLVAVGNLIGRGPHFVAEADRHYLNLYAVMVGPTSKGRKGSSWGQVLRVARAVDEEWTYRVVHGLSSGEGLIWEVRDPITRREPVKEKGRTVGYEDVEADPGVSDKRLLVIEQEFAAPLRVMGRDGNTLSAVIRSAWDTGDLRIMTKNSPAHASGAHISIIGHITREELLRYLDRTDAANGFANRFLWVAVRRSKLLPDGGQAHTVDWGPLVRRLHGAVTFARSVGELRRDDETAAIWREVYPELSEGKPGLLGAVISRAEAQVMRLACLYAVLDLSYVVRPPHLLAALALWEYAEASARWVFGDALGDPLADEILRALRDAGEAGLTRTDLRDLFSRNVPSTEIQRAIHVLVRAGLATIEKRTDTGGRPAEIIRALVPVGSTTKTTLTTKAVAVGVGA